MDLIKYERLTFRIPVYISEELDTVSLFFGISTSKLVELILYSFLKNLNSKEK